MVRALFLSNLLLLTANAAYSCSCEQISHRQEFRESDVIFSGQVISIVEDKSYVPPKLTDSKLPSQTLASLQKSIDSTKRFLVKFKVEQGFKGIHGKEISLFTYQGDGPCFGIVFTEGDRYLAYAYHKKEGLTDGGLCSRTKGLDIDSQEYKELNSFWFRFRSRLALA